MGAGGSTAAFGRSAEAGGREGRPFSVACFSYVRGLRASCGADLPGSVTVLGLVGGALGGTAHFLGSGSVLSSG